MNDETPYDEIEAERRLAAYRRATGAHPSGWHACLRVLAVGACSQINQRTGTEFGLICWPIPAGDHATVWIKNKRPYSITAHPYRLTDEDRRAIEAAAEMHNLAVQIDAAASWHYPGESILIEWRRRNTDGH